MDLFDNNKTIKNPNSAAMTIAQQNYKQLNLQNFHPSFRWFMNVYDSGACYSANYGRLGKLCYIPSDARSRYQ